MTARIRLCLAVLFYFAVCCTVTDAYAVSWSYDIESALKAAKQRNVPVMADFYTSWCGWCTKLDKDTYADQKVNELSREFVCVKIDCEKSPKTGSRYNVRGYPTIIFFDSNGNEKKRITGYVNAVSLSKTMEGFVKKTPLKSRFEDAFKKVKKMIRPEFELTGILYNADAPKAIINDTIVGVGDSVKHAKVTEIKTKSVKLQLKDREIILNLPR